MLASLQLSAQVINPPLTSGTALPVNAKPSTIQYSGTDYFYDPTSGYRLTVACWDGLAGGFSWAWEKIDTPPNTPVFSGITVPAGKQVGDLVGSAVIDQVGPIVDPDIATWHDPATGNWYIVVAFMQSIHYNNYTAQPALYDIYQFNPPSSGGGAGTVTLLNHPTNGTVYPQILSQIHYKTRSPNVDIGVNGELVMVYEHLANSGIYARARLIGGVDGSGVLKACAAVSTHHRVNSAPASGLNCFGVTRQTLRQPDVCVFADPGGTSTARVHFTYVEDDINTSTGDKHQRVELISKNFSNVQGNGISATCSSNGTVALYTADNLASTVDGYTNVANPRIATMSNSTLGGSAHDKNDVVVVFEEHATARGVNYNYIYSVARNAAAGGVQPVQLVNASLEADDNTLPVVAMGDNCASVAWRYNSTEALSLTLDLAGVPQNTDFAQVNDPNVGDGRAPAVASGHLPADNTLYTWFNGISDNHPYYRFAGCNENPLPRAAPPVLAVYPNPAVSASMVRVTPASGEHLLSLSVYELRTGRVVGQASKSQLTAAAKGATEVALRALLPTGTRTGLYAIRLVTSQRVVTTQVQLASE